MLYAASGTVYLGPLGGDGSLVPISPDARALAGLGLVLAIAGIAFKLSVVPFQLWTPDTYAGAPLPVAAFLAAVSKAAGLAALVVVLAAGAPLLGATWTQVLGALAVVSMTVGNLVALRQSGAVRLLAWSTVAQAGWVVLPLAGAGLDGRASGPAAGAAVAYLAAYVVATLLAFAVVAVVARTAPGGEAHKLSAYAGLARRRPMLGAALAFALVALAGLPPGRRRSGGQGGGAAAGRRRWLLGARRRRCAQRRTGHRGLPPVGGPAAGGRHGRVTRTRWPAQGRGRDRRRDRDGHGDRDRPGLAPRAGGAGHRGRAAVVLSVAPQLVAALTTGL